MTQMNTVIVHTADMTRLWTPNQIKRYMFAGHTVFAINDIIYTIRNHNVKGEWWTVYTKDKNTPTWILIGWSMPEPFVTTKDVHATTNKRIWTLFEDFVWWLKYHYIAPNRYKFQISRFCARCGAPLKSLTSQILGYGPECIKKEKQSEKNNIV